MKKLILFSFIGAVVFLVYGAVMILGAWLGI